MIAVELRIANSLAEVDRVAETVEAFARDHGLSDRICMAVSLALHEHLTNIVNYAFEDALRHEIGVRLELAGDRVIAEVRDDGRPYNPLSRPEVDTSVPIDERPIGGLGVHFLRRLMDDLSYQRVGGTNLLRLEKRV